MRWKNHYEQAVGAYLEREQIPFTSLSQAQKACVAGVTLKSFDYLVYPHGGGRLIVDVKGRKLSVKSWQRQRLGQCWATREDLDGLAGWEASFGQDYVGLLVFAYWLYDLKPEELCDVDFTFEGQGYVFACVERCAYQARMRPRSERWQTVYVPAEPFRVLARPLTCFL